MTASYAPRFGVYLYMQCITEIQLNLSWQMDWIFTMPLVKMHASLLNSCSLLFLAGRFEIFYM